MKIKTIWDDCTNNFDKRVNEAMEKGWILGKRELLPDANDLANSVFYAELVLLEESDKLPAEPVPEPQPMHPFDAIRVLRDACEAVPVESCGEGCPLHDWCEGLRKGGDPTDWLIPGEVPEV